MYFLGNLYKDELNNYNESEKYYLLAIENKNDYSEAMLELAGLYDFIINNYQ